MTTASPLVAHYRWPAWPVATITGTRLSRVASPEFRS
jgi:hypothetical protein